MIRITIAGALMLLWFGIVLVPDALAQNALLSVEGENVFEDEFVFFMLPEKALCSNYFYGKFQAEPGPGFWTESFSGEMPLNYIKDKTIQKIVEVKIHTLLAKEYGLLEDISFKSFLERFEETNMVRREKVEAGEIIYGPEKFSRETYFSYWYSNLLIELRKAWVKNLRIDKDSIRSYYERNKQEYKKAGELDLSYVHIPYKDEEQRLQALSMAEKIIMDPVGSKPCENPGVRCEDEKIPDNINTEAEGHISEMHSIARKLQAGQAGGPVTDTWNRQIIVIICNNRTAGYIPPFVEVEKLVSDSYINSTYNSYLRERIRTAELNVTTDNMDDILLKYLH